MRKIALCLLLALLASGAAAQTKVVEKSRRKAPEWLDGSRADYIITSAVEKDLETAKQRALDNVRRYVIESVAQNVSSTTTETISQQTMQDQIVSFLDEYKTTSTSQAAPVPFLKGISASRVEDFYWEKRQDKRSKEVTWVYSILYPFPSVELKSLVFEFQKRDQQMWDTYERLASELDKVSSTEQIDQAIAALNPVIGYLFDPVRKSQAEALQKSYRALYDRINFATVSNELGEYRFQLMLDGRPITTSQRMSLKSESATKLEGELKESQGVVKYDYSGSAWDEENEVTISMRLGGKAVVHKFHFTVRKHKLELWPEGTVYLTQVADGINIRMTMHSGLKSPYTVKSVTMEVPGLTEPLFLYNVGTTLSEPTATLNVTYVSTTQIVEKQNLRLNMLRGNMEVTVEGNPTTQRIDFALPFRVNW